MVRPHCLAVAALLAAMLPASAFPVKETFLLQVGKDKDVLETVTIVAEYDKPPEIANPDGQKWADQEHDSAWTDGSGRHYKFNHHFKATLGSRKGYGSDFISVDDFGTGKPMSSSGVLFTFPGEKTLLYSWKGVHLHKKPYAYPYTETEFITGKRQIGEVVIHDGSGQNPAQGQWVSLLTRKKERPAGVSKPITSRKETWSIQLGFGETPRDTLVLWVDYGKPPEVPHPNGVKWEDLAQDSAWNEEDSWGIRYSHSFMVAMGSRKGYGGDYLSMRAYTHDFSGDVQYNATVGLSIPGDTALDLSWDPAHVVERFEAYPFHGSGFIPGAGQFGQVQRKIGSGEAKYSQGEWAKFIAREVGWKGYQDAPIAVLRGSHRAARSEGWLLNVRSGALMRVPAGARGLRVMDMQGRVQWESRSLQEGASVTLPERLPRGPLRYFWTRGLHAPQ